MSTGLHCITGPDTASRSQSSCEPGDWRSYEGPLVAYTDILSHRGITTFEMRFDRVAGQRRQGVGKYSDVIHQDWYSRSNGSTQSSVRSRRALGTPRYARWPC